MGFPIVWAKSTKDIWANHIHPPTDKDTCLGFSNPSVLETLTTLQISLILMLLHTMSAFGSGPFGNSGYLTFQYQMDIPSQNTENEI